MNFVEHGFGIGSASVSTEHGVETSFVNDGVKGSVFKLQAFDIHLFESHLRNLFFVVIDHLLDHSVRNVNVGNVLVPVFEQLFRKLGVAAPNHEYLE